MEIPHQEVEIPIPLNTSYGGIQPQLHHHHPYNPTPQNHIIPTSAPTNGQNPTNGPSLPPTVTDDTNLIVPYTNKKMVRYRECLKNHAASMGGTATDGCGEFMPSGEEGTIEALTCSACHCHRNFHRKEIEGDPSIYDYFHQGPHFGRMGRKVLLSHHKVVPTLGGPPMGVGPHGQMMLSYNVGPMGSDSDEDRAVPHQQTAKKRFRTKFTQEQKEKMLGFAERVGWKIQKQEESVVQQFCQEIGVKRRVLKVWMHNNKHNLAKKNNPAPPQNPV